MSEQTEFFKKAGERIGAWNKDARKAIGGLVEKGREQQRDIAERLQKAGSNVKVEELTKKVKEVQEKAVAFVDTTSRDRAAAVAEELRRMAARLEQFGTKPPPSPAPDVH